MTKLKGLHIERNTIMDNSGLKPRKQILFVESIHTFRVIVLSMCTANMTRMVPSHDGKMMLFMLRTPRIMLVNIKQYIVIQGLKTLM